MYYFDNKFLAGYIDQQSDLSVYVNDDWYQIADMKDISDPIEGVGYNEYGEGFTVDYKNIDQIKVGNRYFTLDQLQAQYTGKDQEDDSKKKSPEPKNDEPKDEPIPEEEPKEPELDLSSYSPVYDIGRNLINEYFKERN